MWDSAQTATHLKCIKWHFFCIKNCGWMWVKKEQKEESSSRGRGVAKRKSGRRRRGIVALTKWSWKRVVSSNGAFMTASQGRGKEGSERRVGVCNFRVETNKSKLQKLLPSGPKNSVWMQTELAYITNLCALSYRSSARRERNKRIVCSGNKASNVYWNYQTENDIQ